MPLDEYIKGRHGEREPGMGRRPCAVHDLFKVADDGQHGEYRFHQQVVLPRAALTQFEVGGIAFRGMEGRITEDNHRVFKLANQPLKRVIRDIGGGTRLPHHQTVLVQQQTEFAPDDPSVVRETFATNLLGAAAFALACSAPPVSTGSHGDATHDIVLNRFLLRVGTDEGGQMGFVDALTAYQFCAMWTARGLEPEYAESALNRLGPFKLTTRALEDIRQVLIEHFSKQKQAQP